MNTRQIEKANERIKKLSYILRHIEKAGSIRRGTKIQILTRGIPSEGKRVTDSDLVCFNENLELSNESVRVAIQTEIETIKRYIREHI